MRQISNLTEKNRVHPGGYRLKNNRLESAMKNETKPLGLPASLLIFGLAAMILLFETHFLIPHFSELTGLDPVIFWFIIAGLGMFLPLLILAYLMLNKEGVFISKQSWQDRLRFKRMSKTDWLWTLGGVILIGAGSVVILTALEHFVGQVNNHPPFMSFEPLTPGRYWILFLWFPYWILNIMGEEILWRGVILPRQEAAFGNYAWLVHGLCWGIFHIAFGPQLLLTLLPILFIQSYIVQRRQNSWIGVVIHAVINGPSFIAISFGLL